MAKMKINFGQIFIGLIIGAVITFLFMGNSTSSGCTFEPGTQEFDELFVPPTYRFSGIGPCEQGIEISYIYNGQRLTEHYDDCTEEWSYLGDTYCSCRGLY